MSVLMTVHRIVISQFSLLLLMASGSEAYAWSQCVKVFGNSHSIFEHSFSKGKSPSKSTFLVKRLLRMPVEFQYESSDGQSRYYKDGAIWEIQNNNWIQIGYGRFADGLVHEDRIYEHFTEKLLPDLSPLKDFKYEITQYEQEFYYPNEQGYSRSLVSLLQVGSHHIEIAVPKGTKYERAAEGIVRVIAELPLKRIEALSTVRVNLNPNKDDKYWQRKSSWQQKSQNLHQSAASAADGQLEIYPIALSSFVNSNQQAVRIARHEFGHLIASQIFGSTTPRRIYNKRAILDSQSVSEYGEFSWAEDFAEGIEAYLRTNAGKLKPQMRNKLAHRFNFFDDIFSYRVPQSVIEDSNVLVKNRRMKIFLKLINDEQILALAPEIELGVLVDLRSIM